MKISEIPGKICVHFRICQHKTNPFSSCGLIFFLLLGLCGSLCSGQDAGTNLQDNAGTKTLILFSDMYSYIAWMEKSLNLDTRLTTPTEQIRQYRNLTIRQCAEIAFQNNFDLQNSEKDLQITKSNFREAEAEFIPSLTLGGDTGIGKERKEIIGDMQETHSNYQQGSVVVLQKFATGGSVEADVTSRREKVQDRSFSNDTSLALTQPLLRRAGLRRGLASLRKSQLSLLSREISNTLTRRDIAMSVIEQYYTILRTKQELRVSLDALDEKLRFLEATRIKFSLDQIPESEISRSEIQYLQERENVVTRRQSYEDQLERLLTLLGLPLEKEVSIEDIIGSLVQMGEVGVPPVDECIAGAMAGRLELMLSDISIKQQEISRDTARNDLLPDLDLSFQYATNDANSDFDQSYNMRENNAWDANLSLRIPLPNISGREAYKRSQLSLDKSRTDRVSMERDIIREVKQAYRRVKASESSLLILKKTVEQASKSLEQESGRFDAGLSTSNDVRKAQDDLFEAQTRYFTELLNYQINIARLYMAIGLDLF